MSTVAPTTTSTQKQVVKAQPHGATLVDRLRDPQTIIILTLLTLGVIALFHSWFYNQHLHSWGNGDWSHAYLIPLISVYLMWQNRERLARVHAEIYWPGLLPAIMGIWTYVFFIVGVPNHFGQGLSLVLTVFGLTLLMLGPRAMESLFCPIAYLVFGITIPEIVMNYLTYPLQDMAASGGFILLRMLGVSCYLAGNVIWVDTAAGSHPLNVAEQCSGMRMVIAFFALGFAVALVGTQMWWKRVVLVAAALPVAVVLNVVRVAVLGLLTLRDPSFSQGDAHTFIGTILLIPGFFIYLGVLAAMHKSVPESEPVKVAIATKPKVAQSKGGA